jgi:hypothetical protein
MQHLRIAIDGQRRSYIWHSGDFILTLCFIVTIYQDGRISIEAPALRNASLDDLTIVIDLLQECRDEASRMSRAEVSFLSETEVEAWLSAYRAQLQQAEVSEAAALLGGGADRSSSAEAARVGEPGGGVPLSSIL